MDDDIVTQLREIKWHDAETWVDKMAQAADEIERLRGMVIEALRLGALGAVLPNEGETND